MNPAKLPGLLARVPELSRADLVALLSLEDPAECEALRAAAYDTASRSVGDTVRLRGLIEFSNRCDLDCLYCGIRRGNRAVDRYTLTREEIVDAALWCARAGYGSCVLQSGERRDGASAAFVESCVREIKERSRSAELPDGLGITLSCGEQSRETYGRWFAAGAHRYLLRIESSNPALFAAIHPPGQRFEPRLAALSALRGAGFQVGTGVMIGLPGQSVEDLADDLRFMKELDVDMIGMGPYLVHDDAPMRPLGMRERGPLAGLALRMIAAARLLMPDVNIAATTALEALLPDGRRAGILHGANVVMPNVTPLPVRGAYRLYEGKPGLRDDRAAFRDRVAREIESAGRLPGWNRWGDSPHAAKRI